MKIFNFFPLKTEYKNFRKEGQVCLRDFHKMSEDRHKRQLCSVHIHNDRNKKVLDQNHARKNQKQAKTIEISGIPRHKIFEMISSKSKTIAEQKLINSEISHQSLESKMNFW